MAQQVNVAKVYKTVVDDVIANVREAFLDEGVDEQVLQELKQLWESKLTLSKAIDGIPNEQEQLLAQYTQHQASLPQPAIKQQPQPQQQPRPTVVPTVVPQTVTTGQPIVAPTGIPVLAAGQGATIDLSNPAQAATLALYQQHLAALQSGTITLQTGQGGAQFVIQAPQQLIQQGGATYAVAPQVATTLAPVATSQPQAQPGQPTVHGVIQLDGTHDSSSDDDEDYDNDDNEDDNEEDENEGEADCTGEEEDPLNSEDDVSEDDPSEVFDTENVVVCQYDKINRAKNRWKFHLKDGIMNLKGKDYVFQKANGEAEW